MRKSLAFILALLMALSLAACGAPAENASQQAGDKTAVTIKILHYMGNEVKMNAFNTIMNKYMEANPHVTFDSQSISQTEYFTQLRTRIAADDPPDIMMGQPAQYPDIVDSGYVMDLTGNPLIEKLELTDADIGDCSYNGSIYALPLDFKTYGVMYNRAIFAEYGLQEPTTQAELDKICETLLENGVDPWIRNYSNTTYPDIEVRGIFWTLLMENGKYDALEKLMNGEAQFADYPEFEKAVELWTQRMQYSRVDDNSNDITQGRQKFAAGEGAMMYEGTWAYAQIAEFNPDMEIGMFALPRDDGKPNQYCVQLDQIFMVNGKSEHVDETLAFMEFFLSPEMAGFWTAETLNPSVVPGVSIALPEVMQISMDAKESGNIAHAGNFTAQFYGEFNTTWRNLLQAYAADRKFDIPTLIAEMQSSFDEIIKTTT